MRDRVYKFIQNIAEDVGIYSLPLVEESDAMDVESATSRLKKLDDALKGLRVGLIHGKMKSAERMISWAVLQRTAGACFHCRYRSRVNVPNASIMVIENAERFGLASSTSSGAGWAGVSINLLHPFQPE